MRSWTVVVMALGACSSSTHGFGHIDAPPVPIDAPDIYQVIPVTADLDILFVIQNADGMASEQTVFAANFPQLVAALDAFPTGRPNLHIGVVSSTVDLGVQGFAGCPSPAPNDNGLFQDTPRVTGCSPPTGRFISDVKNSTGGRTVNYSGTLDQAFSCIAQLGDTGCSFRAPLEGMKRGLDGSRPENAGFVRNGAILAVIILGNEDDCSATDTSLFLLPADQAGPGDFRCIAKGYQCDQPISTTAGGTYTNCAASTGPYERDPAYYFRFLTTIKPPGEIFVATITGDPSSTITVDGSITEQPSCTTTINGNPTRALAGIRIADFVAQTAPERSGQYTICQSDYSAALANIGQLLFSSVAPCILGTFSTTDVDPNNPGVQLDCTVQDVSGTSATVLPICTMSGPTTVDPSSPKPCWWTDVNAASCPYTTSHFEVSFVRAAPPPAGTVTQLRCR